MNAFGRKWDSMEIMDLNGRIHQACLEDEKKFTLYYIFVSVCVCVCMGTVYSIRSCSIQPTWKWQHIRIVILSDRKVASVRKRLFRENVRFDFYPLGNERPPSCPTFSNETKLWRFKSSCNSFQSNGAATQTAIFPVQFWPLAQTVRKHPMLPV